MVLSMCVVDSKRNSLKPFAWEPRCIWWMEHPDAVGIEEAKRQVERVIAAIVLSL